MIFLLGTGSGAFPITSLGANVARLADCAAVASAVTYVFSGARSSGGTQRPMGILPPPLPPLFGTTAGTLLLGDAALRFARFVVFLRNAK
jgi:hypothetical protein